jgi:hypothetical protein
MEKVKVVADIHGTKETRSHDSKVRTKKCSRADLWRGDRTLTMMSLPLFIMDSWSRKGQKYGDFISYTGVLHYQRVSFSNPNPIILKNHSHLDGKKS